MGLWPLSWQWWCHAIFCANTQEWYGWQICLLWVLKFSAMCKSALRKKFDLIFWAQISVFQKFSFSHIWRTQKAIRICKKKSLKNLANLPFLRVTPVVRICIHSASFLSYSVSVYHHQSKEYRLSTYWVQAWHIVVKPRVQFSTGQLYVKVFF